MAACTIFFLAGQVFIAHLGIEDDEALFAGPIFEPRTAAYAYRVGHSQIPLMLMSYLGTLKTHLYRPILALFGTGPWAVREPALLMGAASVWLFYLLLGRIAGYRAALIGCCLLAADSLYLVTTVFDWGPVALQHLLVTGGLFLLVRFYQTRSNPSLAAGCFLFGLAMWDKALAMWMLSGIGIAGLVIFWRQIFAVTTFRRISIAALAFLLGALPLILYNLHTRLGTLHENAGFDTSELTGKARMLVMTLQGPALFGLLADEDWQAPQPHQPNGFVETAAAGISTFAGHPTHSLMLYAFILSLLLAPLAGRGGLRAIAFSLIAMAVAWVEMAVKAGAGGSVHHSILLWPLPYMPMAVSFAAASRRLGRAGMAAITAIVLVCMISGALVTNEYYVKMVRNGAAPHWSDTVFPLARFIEGSKASNIFCVDWGLLDVLLLLDRDRPPVWWGGDEIGHSELSPQDRAALLLRIGDPANVFVAHAKEVEFLKGLNEKLVQFAVDSGYRREMLATMPDGYGRPLFEVYRFVAGPT